MLKLVSLGPCAFCDQLTVVFGFHMAVSFPVTPFLPLSSVWELFIFILFHLKMRWQTLMRWTVCRSCIRIGKTNSSSDCIRYLIQIHSFVSFFYFAHRLCRSNNLHSPFRTHLLQEMVISFYWKFSNESNGNIRWDDFESSIFSSPSTNSDGIFIRAAIFRLEFN